MMKRIINTLVHSCLALAFGLVAMAFCCGGAGQWSDKSNWYESAREYNPDYPDVFYLVSTNILHEDGSLIADYSPEEKALLTKEMSFIESHMFPDSLNFFAPYYHQHTMDAISLDKESYARLANGIADEAYDAFHYYMEHRQGSGPVVLVGFSQGAMLVKELLERMTSEEYGYIAAAYMLGWGLNEEDVLCPQVSAAKGADDTGVCISFNSVSDTSAIWKVVMNDAAFSINPVNWKTDGTPASFDYKGQSLTVSLDTASMSLIVNGFEAKELSLPLSGRRVASISTKSNSTTTPSGTMRSCDAGNISE